jgi:hypothetical protein
VIHAIIGFFIDGQDVVNVFMVRPTKPKYGVAGQKDGGAVNE